MFNGFDKILTWMNPWIKQFLVHRFCQRCNENGDEFFYPVLRRVAFNLFSTIVYTKAVVLNEIVMDDDLNTTLVKHMLMYKCGSRN